MGVEPGVDESCGALVIRDDAVVPVNGVHLRPVIGVMRRGHGCGRRCGSRRGVSPRNGRSRGARQTLTDDGRPFIRAVAVLLHVLGQVGLLRVALAAILTDVRLEVL